MAGWWPRGWLAQCKRTAALPTYCRAGNWVKSWKVTSLFPLILHRERFGFHYALGVSAAAGAGRFCLGRVRQHRVGKRLRASLEHTSKLGKRLAQRHV